MIHLGRVIFFLAVATLICVAWATIPGGSATAQTSTPSLAIDVGPEGTATDPGKTENCVSVSVGDRFQIDMIIEDVTDLLAWEAPLEFDPAVVVVVDHDVKLFQGANTGSSVIDISAKLPDDSGFHMLSAFESSDPPRADSGSGVLARITLEAVADGESPLRFGTSDLDDDGELDRGVLLRNLDAEAIGDEDGDLLFDGERTDALVAVGGDCPDGSIVYEAVSGTSSGGGSSPWPYVGAGIAAALAVLVAIGAVFATSRRASRTRGDTTEA